MHKVIVEVTETEVRWESVEVDESTAIIMPPTKVVYDHAVWDALYPILNVIYPNREIIEANVNTQFDIGEHTVRPMARPGDDPDDPANWDV